MIEIARLALTLRRHAGELEHVRRNLPTDAADDLAELVDLARDAVRGAHAAASRAATIADRVAANGAAPGRTTADASLSPGETPRPPDLRSGGRP